MRSTRKASNWFLIEVVGASLLSGQFIIRLLGHIGTSYVYWKYNYLLKSPSVPSVDGVWISSSITPSNDFTPNNYLIVLMDEIILMARCLFQPFTTNLRTPATLPMYANLNVYNALLSNNNNNDNNDNDDYDDDDDGSHVPPFRRHLAYSDDDTWPVPCSLSYIKSWPTGPCPPPYKHEWFVQPVSLYPHPNTWSSPPDHWYAACRFYGRVMSHRHQQARLAVGTEVAGQETGTLDQERDVCH